MDQFTSIAHSDLSFPKLEKLSSSNQRIFRKQNARTD